MRPDDYLEFHYEAVTICMNSVKQVVILFTPVGNTHMYSVYVVDRGSAGPLQEDDMTRSWARGPGKVDATGAFNFYSVALQTARVLCGWEWHVNHKPQAPEEMKQEQLEEDARQAEAEEEAEEWTYHGHPSLTASERNPGLTRRRQ